METATTEQTTKEGQEVVSVGRYGQKRANFHSGGAHFSVPIWSAKVYRAVRRQRDGVLTWRLVAHIGPTVSGRNCPSSVIAYAEGYADAPRPMTIPSRTATPAHDRDKITIDSLKPPYSRHRDHPMPKKPTKKTKAKKAAKTETREAWLDRALVKMRPTFAMLGIPIPERVAVSCGFPLGSRKAIGQAWSPAASPDGTCETFVSPTLSNPRDIFAVLIHEALHHAVGHEAGHKRGFSMHLPSLGIDGGKPKATLPGAEFDEKWGDIIDALGPYPHPGMDPTRKTKVKETYLRKCECSACGCILRITQKWLDASGVPTCGCGEEMGVEE